ncbi:DUF58 domain-containing protein [Infirmifilum lucidum]|uniref:DUF58 domain-containing protein n=1 Tax=Infirmifilum lucidum TaxID=2776706 RepID=A0A7L9FI12_9CREN|nr:DUF58 domain-containing protein [Infirmifilum lucidum]QOJ79291.1 DUF58 domain-containing protein [Infirmifilum lucidum]
MKVSPTERGVAFLAMLSFFWASTILLQDQLLALFAAVASVVYVFDLSRLLLDARRLVLEVRGEPVQEVWVWERPGFEVLAGLFFEPVGLPAWLAVGDVEARGRVLAYRFEAAFKYSGVYSVEKITARVYSRLGLFELLEEVPVGVTFRVKPATLLWLQRALALLGVGGSFKAAVPQEALSQVVYLRSTPEEYVGSREYQPGDDLKFIDWKSTARRQLLFVKEFRGGFGFQPLLVFDLRCTGPYTCDAVASAVLSLAVGLVSHGVQASGVYETDTGRFFSFNTTQGLLAYVVGRVLESRIVEELDIYEFIEPQTIDEIRGVLKKVAGLNPGFGAQEGTLAHGNVVYVTSLLHATGEVLDFASRVARSGGILSLVVPAEPWLDARDDVEAERVKSSFHKATRKLSSLGVNVFLCRKEIQKTLVIEPSI